METSDGPLAMAVSVGGAHSSLHGDDPSTLVDTADAALYAAKRGGRNLCVLAHELAPDELIGGDNDTLAIAEAVALVAANGSIDLAGRRAERVAELGARVAEELGLAAEIVHRARLGGWLRDLAGPDAEDVVPAHPGPRPGGPGGAPSRGALGRRGAAGRARGRRDPGRGAHRRLRRRLRAGGDARGGPHRPPARAAGVRRDAGTLFDPGVVLALRHVLARERGARHRRARRAARGERRGA